MFNFEKRIFLAICNIVNTVKAPDVIIYWKVKLITFWGHGPNTQMMMFSVIT